MVLMFVALLGLSTALVCPDGGMCEDRETCCQNTAGGYGCCPLPHADCCSDHLHCCYEGTVCDLVHSKCVNKTVSLPLVTRLPARRPLSAPQFEDTVWAVLCPDQTSECPDDTTCCQLPDGTWGCCPMAKAVCCEDKLHCCPEGTQCDLAHSRCIQTSLPSIPMLVKFPARKRVSTPVSSVRCPGGTSSCPDGSTCCLLASGGYGCCPFSEAVCCSDHIHCCPAGASCDLQQGVCRSGDIHMPLLKKIPAAPSNVAVVPCNDSVACSDGSTCCQKTSGDWACCPLKKAVCCDDHLHCCPHGTVCNLAASTCDQRTEGTVTPWFSKVPAFPMLGDNTKCDESMSCPGTSTCCKTLSGDWACCPLPQAVCCDDHTHCCPHGTVCNLEAETCDSQTGSWPPVGWATKVPALSASAAQVKDEKCDKQTRCPVGTTCCKKDSGLWACCPLPQAVCCSDREHCCPKGYVCNVAEQTCDRPGLASLPWLRKLPALQEVPAELEKPVSRLARPDRNACDRHTSCPRDTTCCFMEESRRWGCCPLPNAVCCKDGVHCCPESLTCDPPQGVCSKGSVVIPWFTKVEATTEAPSATDVKCDDKTSCASGTTCCKLQTGQWGCCPLVKAVCCADHEHCCPQGYSCNMQTQTCEKKSQGAPASVPLSTVAVHSEPRDVPCDPAGEFHCSERDTCCRVAASEWACCPSPKAVCCSDSKHCCPAGYSCDLQAGGCTRHSQPTWDILFRDRKTSGGL